MDKIDKWFKQNEDLVLQAVSRIKWGGIMDQGWTRTGTPYNELLYTQQLTIIARAQEFKEILKLFLELKKERDDNLRRK